MQVLVLGLPRTGTQSLADALDLLGISPVYHMREVGKHGHAELWMAALEAKQSGIPWTRAQFNQMLGGFQAAADYPAAIFPAELLDAYPEAAVILSVRSDEDAWLSSMSLTLIHHHHASQRSSATHQQLSPVASLARRYHKACWGDDFAKNGRALYREHNAKVRQLAVGRSFLECRPGQGWAPLCEFLGVPVPEGVSYPRSDDWAEYKKKVEEEHKASGDTGTAN
ncbi:P-loop containing nucleoside triphosphate hydrolase protein [Dactylonectria estremocensis]|uniref:P-loop containing nucleoside triphosphate hydrolase protein n=1 Tax=Dactylonectria estremocensis TaxID=1079267 RepID=A0A9P9JH63_9HYPO|nr:P-loop containing nucleoside triphosphate hydrolase protein [Dactylonectria estremocensis]